MVKEHDTWAENPREKKYEIDRENHKKAGVNSGYTARVKEGTF